MSITVRTSLTDPLRIATLEVGTNGGAIGITFGHGNRMLRATLSRSEDQRMRDLCRICTDRDW